MEREIIIEKLKELIEYAANADERNAQIVLLCLTASMQADSDGIFAMEVQSIVKRILLPDAVAKRNNVVASKN